MGITVWLILLYFLLIMISVFAFVKKAKIIAIVAIAMMILGIVISAYLWFTSPM